MTTTAPIVHTSCGQIMGMADEGVFVFRGIPYVRPPLGHLRFAPPQPGKAWTGVYDATAFGPQAMQSANPVSGAVATDVALSEDCLSLNIWTPACDHARRPVLVWLHGGAFLFGAGSVPRTRGAVLARRGDLVVVTINYRLGLFGWLRGIDVCDEALPTTGNQGLLDQLAALRWVKEEIAAFGGDPDNVTIFGQSAGAASIAAMLAMRSARGLFHKAIVQSGSTLITQTRSAANAVMESILADAGLTANEVGRLRDLPASQLLDLQERATPRSRGVAYGPVADGVEVPIDPLGAIRAGSAISIPLMVGTNLEERKFQRRLDPEVDGLTDHALLTRLADPLVNAQTGDTARFDPGEAVALYRQERTARGESTVAEELWFAMLSDRRYRVPAMLLAELHAMQTPQTYTYLFTWRSPAWNGKLGAAHGVEIPFVFGTYDAPVSRDIVPEGWPVGALPTQVQDAWIAFARTGNPRTPELDDWDPYTSEKRSTMILGATCGAVAAPYEEERRFWVDHGANGAPRQFPVV